jgi:hypothetical protein
MYSRAKKKLILVFFLPPQPLSSGRKRDERFERDFYNHTYDLGKFIHHLSTELSPAPREIRIHLHQGGGDSRMPWAGRQNVIYEVMRPIEKGNLNHSKMKRTDKVTQYRKKIL